MTAATVTTDTTATPEAPGEFAELNHIDFLADRLRSDGATLDMLAGEIARGCRGSTMLYGSIGDRSECIKALADMILARTSLFVRAVQAGKKGVRK